MTVIWLFLLVVRALFKRVQLEVEYLRTLKLITIEPHEKSTPEALGGEHPSKNWPFSKKTTYPLPPDASPGPANHQL